MTTTTPALWHLVGVYFNQDWLEDYADEDAAVDAFIEESDDLVALLPDEITRTLAAYPTEQELEGYLDSQGCEYRPASGIGYRDWLTQIRSDVAPGTIVSKGLTDELPRSGSIYAEAADGAGFAISTLSSIHWKQRKAFITGPYVTR